MEHHVMPLHSSSPPPLDEDSDGEAGSEEDQYMGYSVDYTNPPSSTRYSSPSMKSASQQPNGSFNHPVGQSQTISTVNSGYSRSKMNIAGKDCDADPNVHLTNGFFEKDQEAAASAVNACSPKEETGFADFTVFTEQAAHPWCCGFTPLVDAEQEWGGGVERKDLSDNLGQQHLGSKHEDIMESEPRSFSASMARENVCTVKHCENRDAALVQPSQDQQPQEVAAAASKNPPKQPQCVEDEFGEDMWEKRRSSLDFLQTRAMREDGKSGEDREHPEKGISTVSKTFSLCGSASDVSFCDESSFEGPSADWEPNVSSLGSPEDQTDWDQTDDEEDQLGNSFVNNNTANLGASETGMDFHYCNQSATQETCATSQSGTYTRGKFVYLKGGSIEHHRDQGAFQAADSGVKILGNLPPSDSFADFCSAPTQGDAEESWAEFKEPRLQEEGKSWTQSMEQVSRLKIDGSMEEEQEQAGQSGETRRNSCQASLSCRIQQLLVDSFPGAEVPAAGGEEEVLNLSALLNVQHPPESEEEKAELPESCARSQCIQKEMWWPHQDLHSAVGLQFQWGGSHTNKTLLRCLGVDTRNIVFIGTTKQPVTVPAFASGLGLLEPTKDSVPAVCSPGHTAVTAQAPPGPQHTSGTSTSSMQEALPSSQLDWSSRGLSSSQDGCSALNLDYFGPEEESRSSNSSRSSSRSNSPPPGVDRELYELTISNLDTNTTSNQMEDTLSRLMSTAEKTSTSFRKSQQEEELSAEAIRVISRLPDLSFMRAKVLMFPSVLVPTECCSPQLQ